MPPLRNKVGHLQTVMPAQPSSTAAWRQVQTSPRPRQASCKITHRRAPAAGLTRNRSAVWPHCQSELDPSRVRSGGPYCFMTGPIPVDNSREEGSLGTRPSIKKALVTLQLLLRKRNVRTGSWDIALTIGVLPLHPNPVLRTKAGNAVLLPVSSSDIDSRSSKSCLGHTSGTSAVALRSASR